MSFLAAIGALISAHPTEFVLFVTAVVSLFRQYVEPRFPKLARAIRAVGIDLPEVLALLREVFPKLPPMPPPPAVLAALAIGLSGCVNYDAIRGAVDVSNGVAQLTMAAAPIVHDRCVAPMELLAATPPSAERDARVKLLEKTCDPIVASYDATRRAHLLAMDAILKAETGGLTLGAVFSLVEELTTDAAELEKEIAQ